MNNKGFTLIEMLLVVVIVGILGNIALPVLMSARYKAMATQVIADVHVIRHAALSYSMDSGGFPRNSSWGRVPPDLVADLPEGFSFSNELARYRWRYFPQGRGDSNLMPGVTASATGMALLVVQARDPNVLIAIRGLTQGGADFAVSMGDRITFLIAN